MSLSIRTFQRGIDKEDQLLLLIRELQEYESELYDRMKLANDIDNGYIEGLYDDCEKHEGQILIARLDDVMVGYAVVLSKVASTEEYEVDYVYGEVTDLMVTASVRQRGIGNALLQRCEEVVRSAGTSYFRIQALAANHAAMVAYEKFGFRSHEISMEKRLN